MTTTEFMHRKSVRYPLVALTYSLLTAAVVGGCWAAIWGLAALDAAGF
jgi:hypothetical protein